VVATESQMLEIGTQAPPFNLRDVVSDTDVSLAEYKGKAGTLVFFISNHCPYVIHIRDQFKTLSDEYSSKGITFIAINSNSIETHPQDGPENMRNLALEKDWTFPFLFDSAQEVAKAYLAACTPDFFLFDKNLKLYYRGQLDPSRPGNDIPVTGKDLRNALDLLLDEKNSPGNQLPSIGCNIKWAPGNEPDYFG
jgi:peroxiredoxin